MLAIRITWSQSAEKSFPSLRSPSGSLQDPEVADGGEEATLLRWMPQLLSSVAGCLSHVEGF